MNRKEIVKAVEHYIRNENARYAFMITGPWGVGKTYLFENYLKDAIEKCGRERLRRHCVYVSLYGINTVEEISKQLLLGSLFKEKSKGKKILEKASGVIGVLSKAVSFSFGDVSLEPNSFGEIISQFEPKKLAICFDDLERTSISIVKLLGYINNLVEHCECKVILLADEKNIGRMYANTNVEQKYLTILTGDRKVILGSEETPKTQVDKEEKLISIDKLKEFNEVLYSDNFVYRDIKEKVIGKTCEYLPDIKELMEEFLSDPEKESENKKCLVTNKKYREFLRKHIPMIVSRLKSVGTVNLRIVLAWFDLYYHIYTKTEKGFKSSEYYDEISKAFVETSLLYLVGDRSNIKMTMIKSSSDYNYVDMKASKGLRFRRYPFIVSYVDTGELQEEGLCAAARFIEREQKQKEEKLGIGKNRSTGKAYSQLFNWRYLEDYDIRVLINSLVTEIGNNKYVFSDYAKILSLFILLESVGLCDDLERIQKIMMESIDGDDDCQSDPLLPDDWIDDSLKDRFAQLYNPISQKRKQRNFLIKRNLITRKSFYESAEEFLKTCKEYQKSYLELGSFTEYLDKERFLELVRSTDIKGFYNLSEAFSTIYFMNNVRKAYLDDRNDLEELSAEIRELSKNRSGETTRMIAIKNLINTIEGIVKRYDN